MRVYVRNGGVSLTDRHLFCFGYGFSAKALVSLLRETGEIWRVTATVRNADKRSQLEADGVEPVEVPTDTTLDREELKGVTHVLLSAPA